jgi:hypothetical protein
MKIKELVLSCGSFMVKDGTQIRFWEDTWVGMTPLKQQFSTIFNIAHNPHATVAIVMVGEQYNISFRRALVDDKLREWLKSMGKINNVSLDNGRDMFRWDLNTMGTFSVRSIYLHLLNQHAPFRHTFIWKLKVPLEIKIFLWYLQRGIILTKDNLKRKNWKGVRSVAFAMLMKQSSIYSLIVTMLNKYGGLFILQLVYLRLRQFLICLGTGYIF